ncbi:MAG: hypothetical protein Q9191_002920 [Dirinaria sp. TL-2023a]
MPSYNPRDHYQHSRPRWTSPGSYHYDDKMPGPYDCYYEHDVRQQYPQTIPRSQPSHRTRKPWPPSPKAEDERTSLSREHKPVWSDTTYEEAQSRGAIDQQPIIIDVVLPPSGKLAQSPDDLSGSDSDTSSESSGPSTPAETVNHNCDQRYVYIPKEGIEIPLTYDEAREPKYTGTTSSLGAAGPGRGRRDIPRLRTGAELENSLQTDLPRRERAPSPYAFVPKPKKNDAQFTGENLLSPETIGSSQRFFETPNREQSRGPTLPIRGSQKEPQRPPRPQIGRHVSAAAYPGQPTTSLNTAMRSSTYHSNSDESDDNRRKPSTAHCTPPSMPSSPESARKPTLPLNNDIAHKREKRFSRELRPASPPRSKSAIDDRAPPSPRFPVPPGTGLQTANVLLQNVKNGVSRRASPRTSPAGSPAGSPTHSPFASPPRTPPSERVYRVEAGARSKNASQKQTPPSPLTPTFLQSPQTPGFLFSDSEHERPSRRYAPKSRRTSPLPSPAPAANLGPQIDIRSPSPANHQKSFSHGTNETLYNGNRHVSLTPFDSQPSSLHPPQLGQRRRASSSADYRPKIADNLAPPDLNQAPRSLSRPRRPSMSGRAVSVGARPFALPPCPRSHPVAGYDDWYTLAGGPSTFSVCPSCRDAMFLAGYERYFKPKSRKTAEFDKVKCDFSSPWFRMACTEILKTPGGNIDLIYALAETTVHVAPCTGNKEESREWYRLTDPENGKSVHDFQVCQQCVHSLETLHPNLSGVFHKAHGHHRNQERACSLQADSKRFNTYISLLQDAAKQADEHRRPPNMLRFVSLAHRIAGIPECSRDDMLRAQEWYIIPHLPEFTVCEDCYDEIIWPAIKKDAPVATDFKRHPRAVAPSHVGVSCQLYSPRMRKVFQDACQTADMQMLKSIALHRYQIEKDLQAKNVEAQRWPEEERAREVGRLVEEWKRWE